MRLLEVADPDVSLLASQYSLNRSQKCSQSGISSSESKERPFVIGSSLNAGFISGRPRYNYGKESYEIPAAFIEKRRKLLDVAANHGVDLRTAALQFSAAPDVASALWWAAEANSKSLRITLLCRRRSPPSSGRISKRRI
jgi:D-threo-aldose 1-dehydrogenase